MEGRVIYLDPAESPAGACDRLEWARAARVILVFPESLRWDELAFAQVQRAAERVGVLAAVVHPSHEQRAIANEVGLPAFENVESAKALPWRQPDHVSPLQRQAPPRRFAPNSLHRFFPPPIGRARVLARAALAGIALVAVGALLLAWLPSARITLNASSQLVHVIVPVTLDIRAAQVDFDSSVVPAQRIDVIVEEQMSTEATGRKDVPRFKATGKVVFFNLLTIPYVVPTNTVVRTTATNVPIRFLVTQAVEVPPAGRAEAPIEALEPGTQGNVGAGLINRVEGVAALAVTVSNPEPTQGGGNVTVRSVTEADMNRLRAALRRRLLERAEAAMREQPEVINSGLIILPETLFIADVQDETFDRFLTEQADQLTLNMRLQVAGLAVDPRDLNAIARRALERKVPQGFMLLDVIAVDAAVAEEGTGALTQLFVDAQGLAGANIDANEVRRLVRGLTLAEAQVTLLRRFSLTRSPQIEVQPSWFVRLTNRLPWIVTRIEARVLREVQ
ncbi:MAG: baseplate J/gp47 family protein [Thermoflexales bacterium]|nr:baseplate J/gp47 family protein [Thermoflexales bacterium]